MFNGQNGKQCHTRTSVSVELLSDAVYPELKARLCHGYSPYLSQLKRADERTRTADLPSLRVGYYRVRLVPSGVARVAATRVWVMASNLKPAMKSLPVDRWTIASFVTSHLTY